MKRFFTLTALLCAFYAHTQPNLTLSNLNLQPVTLDKGSYLSFSFTIKNTGNDIAPASFISFYLCKQQSFVGAVALDNVSVQSLTAGQETQDMQYVYPIPKSVSAGSNYLLFVLDSRNQVASTNRNNDSLVTSNPLIKVNASTAIQQNLPYPVIMVHGLNSSNTEAWDSLLSSLQNQYGWSYGGNMNFCLNQDGNLATSDTTNGSDYKDWTNENLLHKADLYTVNFNVDTSGQSDQANVFESNESAIVKQGIAIRDAIKHVLKVTGRDKVILLSHSMGGLASRQYLQNSSMWQPDGQHHVAKLATLGTPHGGSNSTALDLGVFFGGPDENSEAVRDLKWSYDISGRPGVYLFGGDESYTTMDNSLIFNYNNVDVNCNSRIGDLITGLDAMDISTTLDYSCVIGTGSLLVGDGFGGDGVVDSYRANLKNYYSGLNVDTFLCQEPFLDFDLWHTQLPNQIPFIMQAIDEPKYNNLGYGVNFDTLYFGNFTVQSLGNSQPVDVDFYTFNAPVDGTVNLQVYDIPVGNAIVGVLNSNNTIIDSAFSNGQAYISTSFPIKAGLYKAAIAGTPDNLAWLSPYAFRLSFSATLPISLLNFTAENMGKFVALNWQTENEVNAKMFTIEKSTNNVTAWDSIGAVAAFDNPESKYTFDDNDIQQGTLYYRLKMYDKDNSFTYSPIRSVEFNAAAGLTVTPNPAKDYATVSFKSGVFSGEISLYDAAGRKAYSVQVNGVSSHQVPVSELAAGVYIISIKSGTASYTQKLVISH